MRDVVDGRPRRLVSSNRERSQSVLPSAVRRAESWPMPRRRGHDESHYAFHRHAMCELDDDRATTPMSYSAELARR